MTLLAFFGLSAESAAQFGIKCLAVGGGFLAGYVLGGVIAYLADRWFFRKKTPPILKAAVKNAVGALVAVLVALLVFGEGGAGGLGGGRGDGNAGEKTENVKGAATPTPEPRDAPRPAPPNPPDARPADETVRVTVLGGEDVKNQRFYQMDDDATPRTFEDLQAAVTARKTAAGGRKLVLAVLFPPRNAPAREHFAVTRLVRWANEDAGLDVTFPATK